MILLTLVFIILSCITIMQFILMPIIWLFMAIFGSIQDKKNGKGLK